MGIRIFHVINGNVLIPTQSFCHRCIGNFHPNRTGLRLKNITGRIINGNVIGSQNILPFNVNRYRISLRHSIFRHFSVQRNDCLTIIHNSRYALLRPFRRHKCLGHICLLQHCFIGVVRHCLIVFHSGGRLVIPDFFRRNWRFCERLFCDQLFCDRLFCFKHSLAHRTGILGKYRQLPAAEQ